MAGAALGPGPGPLLALLLLALGHSAGWEQRAARRAGDPAPSIHSAAQVVRLEAGGTARFPCSVTNLGPLVLIWKHGTRVLTAGVGAGTIRIKKDARVSLAGTDLVVANVTQEDAGRYTCELDSDGDSPLAVTHSLQILVAPSLHKHPASGSLVVRQGSSVSLKCQASGFPVPQIQWSRVHGSLTSGAKYQQGPEYSVQNISRHQDGLYRCQASNGVGRTVSQDIRLTVLYGPEIAAELETVHSGLGEQAALSCIVNANPEAVVRWYRDSLMLDSDNQFLRERRGSRSTFIVREVRRENFGLFTCSASNTFGRQAAHILLTGKPRSPVFQSNILSKRSQAHTLSWRTESRAAILEYRLTYRKDRGQGDVLYVWTTLNLRPEESRPVEGGYNQSVVLDNLESDSKYEVRVDARNEWGWSASSPTASFITRSQDDRPKQLPVEPEKTPAPSRTLDHRFSSSPRPLRASLPLLPSLPFLLLLSRA